MSGNMPLEMEQRKIEPGSPTRVETVVQWCTVMHIVDQCGTVVHSVDHCCTLWHIVDQCGSVCTQCEELRDCAHWDSELSMDSHIVQWVVPTNSVLFDTCSGSRLFSPSISVAQCGAVWISVARSTGQDYPCNRHLCLSLERLLDNKILS